LSLLAAALLAPCLFGQSPRREAVTTAAGAKVELFADHLRIDGVTRSRCEGLPSAHPSAIAPLGRGFAVGFREGGVLVDGAPVVGLPQAPVRALAGAGATLWIGTASDGLFTSDGRTARRFAHPALGHAGIAALAVHRGVLHVATESGDGWTIAGGKATRRTRRTFVGCFREQDGELAGRPPGACDDAAVTDGTLPSGHVTALAAFDGELHVATFDGGVFALARDGAPRVVVGAPRHANALLATRERLYVGATRGLFAITGGRATPVDLGVADPHVNGLAEGRDGTLYVATSRGVLAWRGGRARVIDERDGLPSPLAYAVAEAADGALWVGTASGAARLAGGETTLYSTREGRLPHDWVTALLPDGDGVLAGTYDAGVVRLGPRGASARVAGLAEDLWVNPHGLARVGGRLVAATLGGGVAVQGAAGLPALPSDDATAVLAHEGTTWVGTRAGLVAVTGPQP